MLEAKGNEGFKMTSINDLKGIKILIVEPNDRDRNALANILKSDGCRVVTAVNEEMEEIA